MKIIRFGSYESFCKWFNRVDRTTDFGLISANYWHYRKHDNLDIFRFVENGKITGIAFVTPYEELNDIDEDRYLNLFEIKNKLRRRGRGFWFFQMIKDYYKKKVKVKHFVLYPIDDGSERFWRSIGFRSGNLCIEDCDLQLRVK